MQLGVSCVDSRALLLRLGVGLRNEVEILSTKQYQWLTSDNALMLVMLQYDLRNFTSRHVR